MSHDRSKMEKKCEEEDEEEEKRKKRKETEKERKGKGRRRWRKGRYEEENQANEGTSRGSRGLDLSGLKVMSDDRRTLYSVKKCNKCNCVRVE